MSVILVERMKAIPREGGVWKYPFEHMSIGDSFFVPASTRHEHAAVRSSSWRWQQKHPSWRFTTRVDRKDGKPGLRIWRTK